MSIDEQTFFCTIQNSRPIIIFFIVIIIFLDDSMDHPTSFFILENNQLGTFWIGQLRMRLGANGESLLPSITRNQLVDKLATKYVDYEFPCLDVVCINKNGFVPFYGLERWLSKLDYEIKQKPEKLKEVKKLLTAGWRLNDIVTQHSTVNVLQAQNTPDMKELYKKLVKNFEAKGLICVNKLKCKTRKERYEDSKQNPEFLYNCGRTKVLRQIKKTGKMPKDATVEKYQIKEDEIKECMEEVVFCQPCEKEFYKKGRYWYCLCDKKTYICSNFKCKEEGLRLGLKVGSQLCEHNRQRPTCKECGGRQVCEHNRARSICKECGGSQICEHNRTRSKCKECGGGGICEHGRQRPSCKECGGSQICEHNRQRSQCKKCGGSQICEHNKHRLICKDCGGSKICKHNKERSACKICDPQGYIASLRRSRRCNATRSPNPTHTLNDLCITTKEWLKYLHETFEDRYGRPKNDEDEVHIDEIIPCSAWNLPDDNKYCWHYLNSQWLLAEDNLSKGHSYKEEDKLAMIELISSSLTQQLSQPCSSSLESDCNQSYS